MNWWGVNSGPGANDILASGTVTISPWQQLRHLPALTDLGTGASTLLTADLLGLSTGGSLADASLAGLPAVPASPGNKNARDAAWSRWRELLKRI
jgi:hypothetical protein